MKRLYRGGDASPLLHPIDAENWKRAGWTETPDAVLTVTHAQEQLQQTQVVEATPPPSVSRSDREAELNALYYGPDGTAANWAPIKAAAAKHGIVKPEGGWEDAIALILEAEYPDE